MAQTANMSELVQDRSWLELVWGGKAALDGLFILYLWLTGSFWDRSQGDRDPATPTGWLEFRKRMVARYSLAAGFTGWLMWQTVGAYMMGWTPSERLQHLLEVITVPTHVGTDATCVMVGGGLYMIYILRRLQECTRISIFSMRQTMGPLRAAISYALPVAASLCLVADAPALEAQDGGFQVSSLIGWKVPVGVGLYLFGSKIQHESFKILAKLRRNRAGHIVTTSYRTPNGGWFESVSSPQYLGEICIHVGVGLVLGLNSTTWWWLTGSVAASQYLLALSKQRFYRKKFEDYPAGRKALIPYLL